MSDKRKNSPKTGVLIVGAAHRAKGLLPLLANMPDVRIVAIADPLLERAQQLLETIQSLYNEKIDIAADYHEFLHREDVDAVLALGSWNCHIPVCIAAIKAGKYAATEVGAANSLEACWDLVRATEETGLHCMMLENCCYGRTEMMILNMVKQGLFGELIHAGCGYRHDLRILARQKHHFRLDHNLHRNGDLYLTHGVGPVMQWLNINRGNRFLTIRSTASKARNWENYVKTTDVPDASLKGRRFAMGDVISSTLTCANGETVDICHSISLPGPYTRFGRLDGTRGCYSEERDGVWLEGISKDPAKFDSLESLYPKYDHPVWRSYRRKGVKADEHGGMDYLVLRAFIDSVRKRERPPIDTWDTATLLSLSVLSEQSVSLGGQPVPIPDFTDGRWLDSMMFQ